MSINRDSSSSIDDVSNSDNNSNNYDDFDFVANSSDSVAHSSDSVDFGTSYEIDTVPHSADSNNNTELEAQNERATTDSTVGSVESATAAPPIEFDNALDPAGRGEKSTAIAYYDAISTTTVSLRAAVYALTTPPIKRKIVSMSHEGIDVTLLIDSNAYQGALDVHRLAPAVVFFEMNNKVQHAKDVRIDRDTANESVIVGSMNWSNAAGKQNKSANHANQPQRSRAAIGGPSGFMPPSRNNSVTMTGGELSSFLKSTSARRTVTRSAELRTTRT